MIDMIRQAVELFLSLLVLAITAWIALGPHEGVIQWIPLID